MTALGCTEHSTTSSACPSDECDMGSDERGTGYPIGKDQDHITMAELRFLGVDLG